MFYILRTSRILVGILFICSIFQPWFRLDDTVSSTSGIDLAVYAIYGVDKVLFLKQNFMLAIGLFVLPGIITIVTGIIAFNLIMGAITDRENKSIAHIFHIWKVLLPILALSYCVKPFIDEASWSLSMFAIPNIGLLLILFGAICLITLETVLQTKDAEHSVSERPVAYGSES